MTCIRFKTGKGWTGILNIGESFKPGDPAPKGYNAWHDWAEVQAKAGLKQVQCGGCSRWNFPQELSDRTVTITNKHPTKGPRALTLPLCCDCAMKEPANSGKQVKQK